MSHFVGYILQFQEIIVYKIPPGGEGSIAQPEVHIIVVIHTTIFSFFITCIWVFFFFFFFFSIFHLRIFILHL